MELWEAQLRALEVLESRSFGSYALGRTMRDPLQVAQSDLCGICGGSIFKPPGHSLRSNPGPLNIDHVWPRMEGGFAGPGNIVISHMSCNDRKGHRLPTGCEIIALVAVCARLGIPVQLKPGLLF